MFIYDIHYYARTDKAARCSILEVIVLSEQRDNLGENWFAHELPFVVLGNDTGSDFDLLSHLRIKINK